MKKVILFFATALVFYFTMVFVLFLFSLILGDTSKNIWETSLPASLIALLLFYGLLFYSKRKKKSEAR